ncbi:unnamed protein product [Aphanomyces euteiches]
MFCMVSSTFRPMKLNPNAPTFVPSFGAWQPPPAPAATNEYYYDECGDAEQLPDAYDSNLYYPPEEEEDNEAADEINELLAEIERMQIEADLARELEALKAQGRNEEADLWNMWMKASPKEPRQESSRPFAQSQKHKSHGQYNHNEHSQRHNTSQHHHGQPSRSNYAYQPRAVNYH